jgi:hypothetical protein
MHGKINMRELAKHRLYGMETKGMRNATKNYFLLSAKHSSLFQKTTLRDLFQFLVFLAKSKVPTYHHLHHSYHHLLTWLWSVDDDGGHN